MSNMNEETVTGEEMKDMEVLAELVSDGEDDIFSETDPETDVATDSETDPDPGTKKTEPVPAEREIWSTGFAKLISGRGLKSDGRFSRRVYYFTLRNWSWLLAAGVSLLFFVLAAIIMSVEPFGKNSFSSIDSMHQYVPFFSDYQRKLQSGESLFYSWNIGMGQNFLSLFMYYIASPLNLILILFPRTGIFSAFTILVIVKASFTAGAFSYWLSRRRGAISNNLMISGFGIAFALGNYLIGYHWNVMWMDCIMMLPLAVLGLERIFRDESPKLYILSLFYILYCNYYIAFIICIFLVLWFFAHRQGKVKDFFRHGFKFAGCSILAAGMAAFSLLTAFLGIMQTASAGKGFPENGWFGSFFALLKQHFFLTKPIDMDNFDGGLNAYCGVIVIPLFFLFLLSDRFSKAERIRKLLLLSFLMFSFNNTILNFIWHGFHDQYGIPNRFSFVYCFVLLTIGYESFARLRQTETWRLVAAGVLSIGFFVTCYIMDKPKGILNGTWMLVITIALILAYMVFMILRQRRVMRIVSSSIAIASIFVVEICTNGALGFFAVDVANGDYYGKYTTDMKTAVEAIAKKNEEEGVVFCREDMAMPKMLDEATYNGMRSVGTFCSTVDGKLVSTMGRLGCYEGANEFLFYGGNPVLNTLIGVKYIYVRNDDYAGIASHSEPVYDDGKTVKVYENPDALPIGYMTGEDVLTWDPYHSDRVDGVRAMVDTLCGEKNIYVSQSPVLEAKGENGRVWVTGNRSHVVNFKRDDSGKALKASAIFTVTETGTHVIETRQNGVKKLVYKKNGQQMGRDRYQSQLFNLGYLKKGDQVEITMEFGEDASESGTFSLYDYTVNEEAYQRMVEKLSSQGLQVTYARDGKLDGTIDVKEDGVLFTTIPYDQGWTVEVDGKKVQTEKAGDTFLALRLDAGHHEVKMRYVSPGFKTGLLISAACWAFFLLLCHIWRKRRRLYEKKKETASPVPGDSQDMV